jgi:hypothetical protein
MKLNYYTCTAIIYYSVILTSINCLKNKMFGWRKIDKWKYQFCTLAILSSCALNKCVGVDTLVSCLNTLSWSWSYGNWIYNYRNVISSYHHWSCEELKSGSSENDVNHNIPPSHPCTENITQISHRKAEVKHKLLNNGF